MEDLEALRDFISSSELDDSIKKALLDCIYLEMRNSPLSEYQKLVNAYVEK
jgi:hypothetical protein